MAVRCLGRRMCQCVWLCTSEICCWVLSGPLRCVRRGQPTVFSVHDQISIRECSPVHSVLQFDLIRILPTLLLVETKVQKLSSLKTQVFQSDPELRVLSRISLSFWRSIWWEKVSSRPQWIAIQGNFKAFLNRNGFELETVFKIIFEGRATTYRLLWL